MSRLRVLLLALAALLAAGVASPARADEGLVTIQFFKAGWVIGGSVRRGHPDVPGRGYVLSVGGLSYGLTFGGSKTSLHGRVRNIRQAVRHRGRLWRGRRRRRHHPGPQAVVLTNQKGAILEPSGRQTGLIVSLDLSGLALTIRGRGCDRQALILRSEPKRASRRDGRIP